MAFLFKKKEVPEELPDLMIDEIGKRQESQIQEKEESDSEEKKFKPLPTKDFSSLVQQPNQPASAEKPQQPSTELTDDEKGFFKDLIKNIMNEVENLDKLDSWYRNKFFPEDIVSQMREYWEKQSPEVILKSIGSDIKAKLMEKIDRLHQLEKEWQTIYFNLLAKEEEIRKEERELKESLSEIINLFKKSLARKKRR